MIISYVIVNSLEMRYVLYILYIYFNHKHVIGSFNVLTVVYLYEEL